MAINKTSGGLAATIQGQTATVRRWDLVLGDGAAETGTAAGSDLRIHRYNNAGTLIDVPLWIKRDTGVTVFTGSPADQTANHSHQQDFGLPRDSPVPFRAKP